MHCTHTCIHCIHCIAYTHYIAYISYTHAHAFFAGFESQLIHLHNSDKAPTRSRRSLHDNNTQPSDLPPKDIYYEFRAFKQAFLLNFTQDLSFTAPYVVIQRSNTSKIEWPGRWLDKHSTREDPEIGCYYTGSVNGERPHLGVADLCSPNGLVKIFYLAMNIPCLFCSRYILYILLRNTTRKLNVNTNSDATEA